MVKLWKNEGYVEHFNKGLNEETESIKRIPIKSVERIISERKKELLSLLKDNKKATDTAFLSGRMGAILNKECELDPISSKCFKL